MRRLAPAIHATLAACLVLALVGVWVRLAPDAVQAEGPEDVSSAVVADGADR